MPLVTATIITIQLFHVTRLPSKKHQILTHSYDIAGCDTEEVPYLPLTRKYFYISVLFSCTVSPSIEIPHKPG